MKAPLVMAGQAADVRLGLHQWESRSSEADGKSRPGIRSFDTAKTTRTSNLTKQNLPGESASFERHKVAQQESPYAEWRRGGGLVN
jgi:hypothetical protein